MWGCLAAGPLRWLKQAEHLKRAEPAPPGSCSCVN